MRRAAILAGVLLAAAPAQAAKSVYGVVMKTLANPYWGAMEQGVREGARKAGVEYFLLGVESDSAPAQLEICNRVLQAKPAALIAAAVDGAALLPCLKQANAMKIPVADLGDTLDPEATRKAGVEIAFHIGVDDAAAGAAAADYLAGALGKAAKGPVLALEGAAGDAPRQQRMRGFAQELKKVAPELRIVSLAADAEVGKALQAHPDLAGVFGADDAAALGAVEAARAAGRDKLVVIGVGGGAEAVKSILAGRLDAAVALLPFGIGEQAVATMKKALAGEKVAPFAQTPTLTLTKHVLESKTDPLLSTLK